MNRKTGLVAGLGVAVVLVIAAGGWYLNQESRQEKFRAQVQPVVKKISEKIQATAELTGGASTRDSLERSQAHLTDLAGLGADLKSFYTDGARQEDFIAAAQTYLAAAQGFIRSQQEFTRSLSRLEAARAKVKESLDAKVRTSQFSMDFWKESHGRVTLALEAARKEATQARDRLIAVTDATQAASELAAPVVGRGVVAPAKVFADHTKVLEGLPLAKDG